MPFLWVDADDEPSPSSVRAFIERNAIALLSNCGSPANPEAPCDTWLGRQAAAAEIRDSGLWNVNHVRGSYDPASVEALASRAAATEAL
jgi:hypothetical protein